MESTTDPQAVAAAMSFVGVFIIIWLVIVVGVIVALIIPIWKILKRMGIAPGWSFLILAPFGSLIGLYLIAFGRWPAAAGTPAEKP